MKNSSERIFEHNAYIGGGFDIMISHRRSVFATNPMHCHENCELTIYTEGHKSVYVNDTVYISDSGCAFTFRPDEMHCGIHRAGECHERYVITFSPDSFDQLPGGRGLLRCFFEREAGANNMIVMPDRETARCLELLDEIFIFSDSTLAERESMMLGNLIVCLSMFNRYYLSEYRRHGDGMSELLNGMIRYIDTNLTASLNISELSRCFGVSISTTERLFRDSMLMTPKRFIIMRRIQYAKKLLQSGASVTDACYNSGFRDYSHFIADFRREVGVTPAKYKMQSDEMKDYQ